MFLAKGASMLGRTFAIHMSLLFNAYAHVDHGTHDTAKCDAGHSCCAQDICSRAFAFISSGESYHAWHHKNPMLAQNSPVWQEDWTFWFIQALEKVGLVWNVRRLQGDTHTTKKKGM